MRSLSTGFLAVCFLLSGNGFAAGSNVPHMDLEMTSEEYRPLVSDLIDAEGNSSPELQDILRIGKRNLEWIDHINSRRNDQNKIELSSAATQTGYPIESPTLNNEALVLQSYADWLAATPASVSDVLIGEGVYPDQPPMADDQFLVVVRLIDRIYQRTSRWLLQVPYLEEYKLEQKHDIRGYYHLSREADLESKLKGWNDLSDAERSRLSPLLVGQCYNAETSTLAECEAALATAVTADDVWAFYQSHLAAGKAAWDAFYGIPVKRTDIAWTSAEPNLMTIPFRNPQNEAVLNWLRDNIQDEWKWNGWQLQLNFVESTDENITHVEFEEGATPHVNGLAGNIITMDGNRSLNEYSSRWTIRHEYGHVLGFPDCYVEFFDATTEMMVSYQLDINDLMCSRRGHLLQRHYDEMSQAYFQEQTSFVGR